MAVSNRFNRLGVEELEKCSEAFSLLSDVRKGVVRDMAALGNAVGVLERCGILSIDSSEEFERVKMELDQAMQKQKEKGSSTVARGSEGRKRPPDVFNDKTLLLEAVRQGHVKLVSGDYLVSLHERGESVRRQQDLPEEAFMPFEDLQGDDVELVAISYCWCSPNHPDPEGFHLSLIVKMLKALMAGKYVDDVIKDAYGSIQHTSHLRDAHFSFGAAKVAIFWDFLSLPQHPRTEAEQEAFDSALSSINAWYASVHTTKWILRDLPRGLARASYDASGWTCFEYQVSNIVNPPARMLTLSGEAYKLLTTKDVFGKEDYIQLALLASQAGRRKGPMDPVTFDKRIDGLTFTNGADKEKVKPKYHAAFRTLVAGAAKMSFRGFHMASVDAEQALELTLSHCRHLQEMDLGMNPEWHKGLDALVEAIAAAPCFHALTRLDLSFNKEFRGDMGCFSRLQHLRQLNLSFAERLTGNIADLSGMEELQELQLQCTKVSGDVKGLSTLVHLQALYLHETRVSGDVKGLSPLVQLQWLILSGTQVRGDVEGLSPLVHLQEVDLRSTEVSGDFEALRVRLPGLVEFYHD